MTLRKNNIYLDYAAATPVDQSVIDSMHPYWNQEFSNPSSIYSSGRVVQKAILEAKNTLAGYIHASPDELLFTSGATDGNTKVLYGLINALLDRGMRYEDMHIIMSAIEHTSVRDCIEQFARRGVSVSVLPVTKEGVVTQQELQKALRTNTILVSVMLVNNEIGTIQPIAELAHVLKNIPVGTGLLRRPLLHTDAAQAVLFMDVHADILQADYITFDGQKMYGPKGSGLLYKRRGVPYAGFCGISQGKNTEGTLNVPAIIGLTKSFTLAERKRPGDRKHIGELRDYFITAILERFPKAVLNGSIDARIANNVNVSFPGIESDFLILQLDHYKISASSKSACLIEGGEGSYVIRALGSRYAANAVRFTLGRETTKEDIDYTVSVLADIIH